MTVLQAEPLLQWSDALKELIGFIALFLGAGGIGFRYFAMRGADMNDAFNSVAARRAAVLGLVGIGLSLVMVWVELPGLAGRKHLAVGAFVGSDTATQLQIGFLILAFIGFALASAGIKPGWPFAASGVIAGALRQGFLGQWSRLVNPVHSLAAGLWIGTLLVLVVAGITPLLRREISGASRAQRAADMVNRFSPFALTMGGIVVLFGVITAWRHLHVLSNLWSTPYGYALIVKLLFAASVFALGAWNWRRQRPQLGSESAAVAIRRSATAELTMAALVLIATAIVVSLPAPKG